MSIQTVQQLPGYGPPTPVPIFQWEKEFEVVLDLYRRVQPQCILEVGTYHGGTLYHWLQNAADGTRVVSVDSYAVGVDNRHLYEEWIPQDVDVELHALRADSHDQETVDAVAQLGPYDWTFIDAGHYYDEVRSDWELYGPLTDGVVLFHDILPPSREHPEIEVDRLWQEIKLTHHTLEVVHNREASWGGIGIVLL